MAPPSSAADYAEPAAQPAMQAPPGQARAAGAEAMAAPAPSPASPSAEPASSTKPGAAQAKTAPDGPKIDPGQPPLLIYEGGLGLDVPGASMHESVEAVIDAAESLGGFLLKRSNSQVEVRVPSRHFREAMKRIAKLGDVSNRSVTAQDVSEEYHDLSVRLKNLEAVRNRLEQFLARTKNVTEALTVGKELDKVARQIDQIKGRMQFLKTRAAYSVIRVSLHAKRSEKKIVRGPKPTPKATPRRLQVDWLRKVGVSDLLSR